MDKKPKKIKKKYSNSKLHFIIFQTSKNPINISISKWFVYSTTSILFIVFLIMSAMSYYTHVINTNLTTDLSTLEKELQELKIEKVKLGIENSTLKDSLDNKSLKIADALTELENLQSSIKEIKQIVGMPVEENNKITTTTTTPNIPIPPSAPTSRSMTTMRGYNNQTVDKDDEQFDEEFEGIAVMIDEAKKELEQLKTNVEDRKQYLQDAPILFPTNGKLTSYFGSRWGGFHRGIDISNNIGTKVYVSGNGVVIESKFGNSYGNYILVQHKNGFRTRYAHLSKRLVKVGAEVKQGDLIGLMGNTGTSYGSHLHYEIYYNGNLINPLKIDNYLKYKE